MKSFLLLTVLTLLALICGCTSFCEPNSESLACVLTVKKIVNDQDGDYLLSALIYDEDNGKIIATPKLLLKEGREGSITLQEASTNNFSFCTNSFGQISCGLAKGLYVIANAKNISENTVDIKFFALLQVSEKSKISMQAIDISSIKMNFDQPMLLINRAKGVVAMPVNITSNDSIDNARTLSLIFFNWSSEKSQ